MGTGHNLVAVVADDHELFRSALAEILRRELGFSHIVEAGTLDDALNCLARIPNVTFASLDLMMPGMDGGDSLSGIRQTYPDLRLAVVSGSERREDILSALAAGVHGYIPKTFRIPQITAAVRVVIS